VDGSESASVNQDLCYIAIGIFVIVIALFKRELLVNKNSLRVILGISVALFGVGLVLPLLPGGRGSAAGTLLSPLLSVGVFRVYRRLFLKRVGREPVDTVFNSDRSLAPDRAFNLLYFMPSRLVRNARYHWDG
jgi:hypothetical protein